VRRLNAEVVRVVQAAEVRGKLEAQYYEVVGSTPEAFARWMASEYEKWGRVIREQKITLD
jgi:tripartite-type tricarboxylate transporter receptor subunit TctC